MSFVEAWKWQCSLSSKLSKNRDMSQLKKYMPYILGVAALVTLYFNYEQWRMMKAKDCNCGDEQQTLGPIN